MKKKQNLWIISKTIPLLLRFKSICESVLNPVDLGLSELAWMQTNPVGMLCRKVKSALY